MEISSLYELYKQHPIVTTDSRDCPKGSIFFALKGASFNGNEYANGALNKGCAYVVVDEEMYANKKDNRFILVKNCLKTLQQLANFHRKQFSIPVIQITGTNGKTTTKELIASVLSKKHRVLYTQGNLNNHIGVPKTLLRLNAQHTIAVIETGANHPGEIKELAEIVEPDYGIITNVGKAHLEGFGSFEGVIKTKSELYDYLRAKEGTIFLHKDNPYLKPITTGMKRILYGKPNANNGEMPLEETECSEKTAVEGCLLNSAPYLKFRWRQANEAWHEVESHLIGGYNIDNMLAAACIGLKFGISPLQIDEALSEYIPENNRSQLEVTASNKLIIDAYNANPTSMMAALENFRDMKVEHKMVILGDMKELGTGSREEHQKIVDFLKLTNCFEQVWLVGEHFKEVGGTLQVFDNIEQVKEQISTQKPEGYYILIKGSNGIKLYLLPSCL